jgi:DNA primase
VHFRGKEIDPISLWGNYCDGIKDEPGGFLSLTYCPNPNHPNSRTPAFQINTGRPTVHCFSHCGISGSYEHAVCVIEDIYEKHKITDEDLRNHKRPFVIGEDAAITASRAKVRKAYREARKIIFKNASVRGRLRSITVSSKPEKSDGKPRKATPGEIKEDLEQLVKNSRYLPKEALAYLNSRDIDQPSRGRWELGYDEKTKRIIIPARDKNGKLLFVIRRGIHKWQRPAYLYPAESGKSRLLFGACNLDLAMVDSDGLILVEGSLDCIKMHQWGYRNTVAILGNSISVQQKIEIARLRPKRVYLFFDKDAGGVQALESAEPLAKKYQIKVVLYPKGNNLDPAKLSRQQVEKAVRHSVPLLKVKQKLRQKRREAIGSTIR